MAPSRLKNPRTKSEVTAEWLEVVLSQSESKTCPGIVVKVKSFQISSGCGTNDNFSADVTRIAVEAEVTHEDDEPSPQHYSLFTKFLKGNEFQQAFAKHAGAPKREQLALSDVLPAFNAFQREQGEDKYHINAPRHVYDTCSASEYVLVMEDVREAGFHVEDKLRGLDLQHLRMAVEHLAKFHGVSYAFCRTHDFLEQYPDFKEHPIMPAMILTMCEVILEHVQFALKCREKEFPDLSKSLTENMPALIGKIADFFKGSATDSLACLCHGDYWTNNIMFKHGEGGTLEDLMMIDWGNAGWRNPIIDLHYLVNSSTRWDLRKNHLEDIQRQYFDTFMSTTEKLGAALPFSGFEDFLAEWRRTAPAGLALGIIVNLVALYSSESGFKHGTLSKGLMSKFKTKVAWATVPIMSAHPPMKLLRTTFKQAFKGHTAELVSTNNEMTSRIFDLMTEAHQAGVLD